jgi:hypothetical protein
MGTRLWFCALKEETIQLLIEDPSRIDTVIERVAKPPPVRSISPAVRLIQRLIERQRTAAAEGDNIDIDKAWHGLHFLMTGTAWSGDPPLNFLLAGGTKVADDDDCTTRLYSSNELREINRALKAVDQSQLKSSYNPSAMLKLDIYPDIWQRDARAFEYCIDHFAALRKFIARAEQSGLGMVTKLS